MGRHLLHRKSIGSRSQATGVNAAVLRKVAVSMLPFYRTVAFSRNFADQWSRAVVTANLDKQRALLTRVAPLTACQGLGTNGIGYFVDFDFRNFVYTSGMTIPPGTVQFVFEPRAHQAVARAILPLYRRLAVDRQFTCRLLQAIRANRRRTVDRLVRSVVGRAGLKAVIPDDEGITLSFKFPFSNFIYRHLLFEDKFFRVRQRSSRRLKYKLSRRLDCRLKRRLTRRLKGKLSKDVFKDGLGKLCRKQGRKAKRSVKIPFIRTEE